MSEIDTQQLDTDNDSDGGSAEGGCTNESIPFNTAKLLASGQRDLPANITTDYAARHSSSIQPFPGHLFQNFNWLKFAQQASKDLNSTTTSNTSDVSASALSQKLDELPSPTDVASEEPLDLSAKPSQKSSTTNDLKTIRPQSSRAVPRSSEHSTFANEFQSISFKNTIKGTKRCSVPPLSSRKGMYEHYSEECGSDGVMIGEKEKGQSDEDGDAESIVSTLQLTDEQENFYESTTVPTYKKISESNDNFIHFDSDVAHFDKAINNKLQRYSPNATEGNEQVPITGDGIDRNILLQMLWFLSSNIGGLDERVTLKDLFTALLANSNDSPKEESTFTENSHENASNLVAPHLFVQHNSQGIKNQHISPFPSGFTIPDTPEKNSTMNPNESYEDQISLVRIPSLTSAIGLSSARETLITPPQNIYDNSDVNSNMHRNGTSPQYVMSPHSNSLLKAPMGIFSSDNSALNVSHRGKFSIASPPLPSHQNVSSADCLSPSSLSINDVITSRIEKSISEQTSKKLCAAKVAAASMVCLPNDCKKPSISVIKNIGGTDTKRFGAAPNLLAFIAGGNSLHSPPTQLHLQSNTNHSLHHQPHHLSRQEAAALAAGKGTRPKRGKYRNYDRDSLVEAVKAVQRGEMSVHRAGSYYGVPHSTLEYKVKERHLMRPRKREAKCVPGLDSSAISRGATSSSKSNANIPGLKSIDKVKPCRTIADSNLNHSTSPIKQNNTQVYSSAVRNGIKLPIFDPSNLLWQRSSAATFSQLQTDFNRNSVAQKEGTSATTATHIHHEDDVLIVPCEDKPRTSNSPSLVASAIGDQNLHSHTFQSASEITGNFNESSGANGSSFLDGIIRKSLDRKSVDITRHSTFNSINNAISESLLNQLVRKTPLPFSDNQQSDFTSDTSPTSNYDETYFGAIKRSSSPPTFSGFKRERMGRSPKQTARCDDEDSDLSETSKKGMIENDKNTSEENHGNQETNYITDSFTQAIQSQNTQLKHNTQKSAINGDSVMPKPMEIASPTQLQVLENTNTTANTISNTSSILQEKLSKVKSQQVNKIIL